MNGGRAFEPPPDGDNEADDLPLLENWRMVAGVKLVGEVAGHPELADGWMLTSRLVAAPDPVTRTARCESRVYRLGEAWPADASMPAPAREMVIRGILGNLRPFPVADLAKAHHAAATLAETALRPGDDPFSGFIADGDGPPGDCGDSDSKTMAERDERLSELARRYAAGEVTWREIADECDDLAFGDLLLELAHQGLSLPTVTAAKRPAQAEAWEAALQRAAGNALDEQPERTRRLAAECSDRHWPALAALAHELPEDERPRTSAAIWISVRAPGPMPPTPDIGKWCIVRPPAEIDTVWQLVRAAVLIGKLWAAKVSGCSQAIWHGTHLICVYCPDSANLDDVRRARAVLRELGLVETLGYKTDRATRSGVQGDAEWTLRE